MAVDLFISEYVEGSAKNQALELYNNTGAPIDLSGYTLELYFNGKSTPGRTITLSGTVADSDVFVIARTGADAAILAEADQTSGNLIFSGDDAIVLKNNGAIVDSIGQVGTDPGSQWGSGLTSTSNNTLRRNFPAVDAGDTNPNDAFEPATEWQGLANNDFSGLGEHPTAIANTAPVISLSSGSINYAENSDSIVIDSAAIATDDTPNFNTGTLTVGTGGTVNDILAVRDQGTGTNQVGVSGSDISYAGTVIGSVTGGNGSPLTIAFNASANTTAVQAVMRNVTYANSSENPEATARTVEFVLTDGDSGVSNTATRNITLTAINDAPVNNFPGIQTTAEEQDLVFNTNNNNLISITDVDAGDNPISVQLRAVSGSLAVINPGSATVGNNGSATVDISGTLSEVNTALDGLTFMPASNFTGNASIQIITNDNGSTGTGGTKTDTNFVQISVSGANDAPGVTLPGGAASYTENAVPVVIDGTSLVSDVDSLDFNGATLTVELTAGGTGNDRLAIRNQGDDTNQVGLDGQILTYAGVRIGTYTGGTRFDVGLEPLVISFDTTPAIDVLPEIVESVLRNTTYANVSENPNVGDRTVQVTLREIDNTTSAPVTQTINLTATNDSPLLGNTLIRYDGSLGTLPTAQGWTYVGPGITPTVANGATNLNTLGNSGFLAGFSRADQTLDADTGFSISFAAQINSENHAGSDKNGDGIEDRAGFSLVVVSDDASRAIELGFWSDRIWVQADGTEQNNPGVEPDDAGATGFETLFTQAEGANFNTTSLVNYDLTIKGDTYTLYANGNAILSGETRDYQAFSGPIDPYETANLIAFSDNTPSAQANVDLASVAVSTGESLANVTYKEDAPTGTALFESLRVSDVDSTTLTGATLSITAGLTAGDELTFADQGGITGSYSNGVLTLSGSASAAAYQSAIQTITYSSTSADPTATDTSRTIEVVVNDGSNSNTISRVVDITEGNNIPQVTGPVEESRAESAGVFTVDLLSGATDSDVADTLNVTGLTLNGGNDGGVTVNGNTLSVDADFYNALESGQSEVITYSYDISDGNGGTVSQTATVTITGDNATPVVSGAVTASGTEDDAIFTVDLLVGASDPDVSNTLTAVNVTLINGDGTGVTVNGNELSVDPSAYNRLAVGESQGIIYRYDISDGNGGSVQQQATLTITGANDAPTITSAVTETQSTDGGSFSVDLLAGATDPDTSDVLSVSNVVLDSGNRTGFTTNGNRLDVDPSVYSALASGESEVITYTYDVVDGNGGTVSQTATVTITGTNADPIVSEAVSAIASEEDTAFVVNLLAGATDADTNNTLNVADLTLTNGDDSGITINGNTLDVDPTAYNNLAAGASEIVTYSYNVSDGNGGTASQTATVTITGENDIPTITSAINETQTEDAGSVTVDLLAGSTDADSSDTLTVANLTRTSGNGAGIISFGSNLSVSTGAYSALAVGESAITTYSYDISDGNGGTVSQTATITITGENDGPTVDSAITETLTDAAGTFTLDLLAGSADVDATDTLNVTNLTLDGGSDAGITDNGNALEIETTAYNGLADGESEVITYSYDISDGNGGTVSQTATITITGTNNGPTIASAVTATETEDAALFSVDLLQGASDADTNTTLSVAGLTLDSGSDAGITINGNSLSVDPAAYNNLAVGESEVITYSYSISDGDGGNVSQTATITITGENDGPAVNGAVTATQGENAGLFSIDLLAGAADPDSNDELSVSNLILDGGSDAGVTINSNELSIDAAAYSSLADGESEVISYSYTIEDGNGGTVSQTAEITITGTNGEPTVAGIVTATETEDGAGFSVDLLAGATDTDTSNTLTVTGLALVDGSDAGVTINGNSLDVDPAAYNNLAVGETEVVIYSYSIEDGSGGTVSQTAEITITGENDTPVVSSAVTETQTEEAGVFIVDLLAGSTDPDASDVLSVANLTLDSGDDTGVTINGDSIFVDAAEYNALANGESEVITYSYDVSDGNGGVVSQTATVTITGTNDSPTVGAAVTATESEDGAIFSVYLLQGATDSDGSNVLNVTNLTLVGGDDAGVVDNGNSLTIFPAAYNSLAVGETAIVTYRYDISDGNGGTVNQTATVTITGENDAPMITSAVVATGTEDASSFSVSLLAGVTDPDTNDTLTLSNLTATGGNTSGVIRLGNTLSIIGSVYNNLALGESEVLTYTYDVSDGNGGSVTQTAEITITGQNDVPVVTSTITETRAENAGVFTVDLLAGATDADATDTLNAGRLILNSGSDVGVSINGNELSVDAGAYAGLAAGESEAIAYTYSITDGNGGTISQTATITITGTNNAPTVTGEVTATASEDDATISVDLLAGAGDADTSDTLSVTGLALLSGNDAGVTINTDSLTVDPAAYNNLAVGESAVIAYTYTITDGNGGTVEQIATVTVTGENDGPAVGSAIAQTTTEQDAPFIIDLLAGATDPDSNDILSVTNLRLDNGDGTGVTDNGNTLTVDPTAYSGLAAGESAVIAYSYDITDGNGGTVSQTATLTVIGDNDQPVALAVDIAAIEDGNTVTAAFNASDADLSDLLSFTIIDSPAEGSVVVNPVNPGQFVFDPGNDFQDLAASESRDVFFTYTADDGRGVANSVSDPATVTVTVTGTNDTPIATLDEGAEFTTDQNTEFITGNVLTNDTDVDTSDTLTVQSVDTNGTSGTVINNNDGTFSYDPNGQFSTLNTSDTATDSFSYTVSDGNGGTATNTVNITINGLNDAPTVSAPLSVNLSEESAAFLFDLLIGASDSEGDALSVEAGSFTIVSGNDAGVTLDGNNLEIEAFIYNALADGESEVIEIAYNIVDGNGGVTPQTATITVEGVNDIPTVVGPLSETAGEDDANFEIDLLTGAADVEGQTLSVSNYTVNSGNDFGITLTGSTLQVDPSAYVDLGAGESEVVQISYSVEDTQSGAVAQTATITIVGSNDQPVAFDFSIDATEDGGTVEEVFDANDGDLIDDGNLTFSIIDQPVEGSVSVDPNDETQFIFDPGTAFQDLAEGETRDVFFTYTADDNQGQPNSVSELATVTVTVTGTNDAPISTVDEGAEFTTDQDTTFTTGNVLFNDSDVDTSDILTVQTIDVSSTNGTVINNNDGTFTYNPNGQFGSLTAGQSATDSFTYTVADGQGGTSTNTVNITIEGVNDDPIVSGPLPITLNENTPDFPLDLLLGASDPDGDAIAVDPNSFTIVSGDDSGLSLNGNFLNISAAAYNRLETDESETITVTYNITDGNGGSVAQMAIVTIDGINDNPVVAAPVISTATEENSPFTVDLLAGATDVEGQTLSVSNYSVASGNDAGITLNGTTLDVDPSLYDDLGVGESEVVNVTYSVDDTQDGTVSQTATITITGANDQPDAIDVAIAALEDGSPVTEAFDANDGDLIDDGNLTFSIDTPPTEGSVGVDPNDDTQFIFDPGNDFQDLAEGETREVTFTYVADDGQGAPNSLSAPATVTVTVTGTNDTPVATLDAGVGFTTDENVAFTTGSVLINDTDVDASNTLTVQDLDTNSTNGIVTNNGDGTFDYDPNGQFDTLGNGETVTDTFDYTITDDLGSLSTTTVTITINGANNDPVVSAPLATTTSEDTADFSIDLLDGASDIEGNQLTVNADSLNIVSGNGAGITINGNQLDINPAAYDFLATGDQEVVQVSVLIEDGNGGSVLQTVDITINGVNNSPVTTAPITAATTEEDPAFIVDLLEGTTDAEAQTLSVSDYVASGNDAGITLNGTTLEVDPSFYNDLGNNESEVVTITFNINDTEGGFVSQTATLTINGANDPPVAIDLGIAAIEDAGTVTASFDANDSDLIDDGNLTFSIESQPIEGSVAVDPNDDTQFIFDPGADFQDLAEGETREVTFTYIANDNQDLPNSISAPATVTVTVTGTNDAPVATLDEAVGFTTDENTPFTTVSVLSNDSDVDTNDVLFVDSFDTTGTLGLVTDNADGTFGYDPNGQFSTLANGESATDTFSYTVADDQGGSDIATVTITINGANDAPIVSAPLTSRTDEDAVGFSLDLLDGATDAEGNTLTVNADSFIVSGNGSGLSFDGNVLNIDPAAYNALATGEKEIIQVSYLIEDGNGGTVSQTADITIDGINDTPVVTAPLAADTTEDATLFSVDLLEGATDAEGQVLTVNNYNVVNGNDTGITLDGTSLNIDPTLYGDLGTDESEVVTLSFDIEDTQGETVSQTATVTITGRNDQPIALDVRLDAIEDGGSVTQPFNADDSDLIDDGNLTFSIDTQPAEGTVIVDPNDSTQFIFDPGTAFQDLAEGATRKVSFTYTVDDGQGQTNSVSDPATVTVTVTGTNDGPVAILDEGVGFSTGQDTSFTTGNVLSNDTDIDAGDVLSVSGIDTSNTTGLVVDNADGTFNYDPSGQFANLANGETATDTFSYTVSDGNGRSDTATVNILINGLNDPPTVSAPLTSTTNEDTAGFALDLLEGATDPEGNNLSVNADSYTVVSGDDSGISLSGNTLNIDPSAYNALGDTEQEVVQLSYTIEDGNGGSISQTAGITIDGINDAPTVTAPLTASATESTAAFSLDLLEGATDAEGQTLSVTDYSVTNGGNDVGITLDGTTLNIDPTLYSGLGIGQSEVVAIAYNVADTQDSLASQTATITITGENDQPVATNINITATEDGSPVTEAFNADDSDLIDNDTLTFNILSQPTEGSVALDVNNASQFVFTPSADFQNLAANETREVSFTYTADDGQGQANSVSDPATVTVSVAGVNDAPVAVTDEGTGFTTDERTSFITASVLTNDSDIDASDVLSIQGIDTTGTSGTVINNNDSTFSYDPNGQFDTLAVGESGVDSFTYTVNDGNGGSETATVNITIDGLNNEPVVSGSIVSTANEDATNYSVDLLEGATDGEGASLTVDADSFRVVSGNSTGITLNGSSLEVMPTAYDTLAFSEREVISVAYNIVDGSGGSVAQTAEITIEGINDDPTVVAAPLTANATEDDNAFVVNLLEGASDVEEQSLSVESFAVTSGSDVGVTLDGNSLNVDPSAYASLRIGATEVITVAYNVVDSQGGTVAQTTTVTITGASDGPVLEAIAPTAPITELPDASAQDLAPITGTLNVQDADIGDTLTASVVGDPTITLNNSSMPSGVDVSALTAASAFTLGAPLTANGSSQSIGYSYDPTATDLDFLNDGDLLTVTYTVKVSDGTVDSVNQTVAFTITGTNDSPVIETTAPGFDVEGSVTELTDADSGENTAANTAALSDRGSVIFSDADFSDTPIVDFQLKSFNSTASSYLDEVGTFSLEAPSTSGTESTFSWQFAIDDGLLDGLGGNDTITQVYTLTATDTLGAIAIQDVTITLNGTNDAPVASDDAITVDENFEASGNLFNDLGNGIDSDVDEGATFSITALNGNSEAVGTEFQIDSGALVTLNADGTFNYDPNGVFDDLGSGQTATDSFTYTITDDLGATDTATVSVTVNGNEAITYGSAGNELISGTAANDTLIGGGGSDVLLGGGGDDVFVYQSYADRLDLIRDFSAGDRIDLHQIFDNLPTRYRAASAVDRFTEYVQLVQQGSNTEVQIDLAGDLGNVFRPLLTIENVTPNNLSAADFVV